MQGLLPGSTFGLPLNVAKKAYKYADAILVEMSKMPKGRVTVKDQFFG